MKKLITTVTVDGEARKYDILTEFRFVGFLESHTADCRYEILECPDEPAHTAVVRVPYNQSDPKDPKPVADKAEKVFENVSHMGFKPAVMWALNRVIADLNEAYDAARKEEQAERARAKEKAEREKAKAEAAKSHAPTGLKDGKGGKSASVKVQTAKVPANGDKQNGHTNGQSNGKGNGKRPVSQEAIRRKARG